MIQIGVQNNVDQVVAQLAVRASQIPYATAVALTRTAGLVKDAEIHEEQDVFDRPTPYTLAGFYVQSATKANLEAVVALKDDTSKGTPADKYLNPEIRGGERRLKRFEIALLSVGALPEGYFIVPGAGITLDQYGNVPASVIVQVPSYFRAFPVEGGYHANITDQRRAKLKRGTKRTQGYEYFVGAPGDGKLPLGIWKRTMFARGSAIKPMLIFVSAVNYHQLFGFGYVAQQTVKREFNGQFAQALEQAIATAR